MNVPSDTSVIYLVPRKNDLPVEGTMNQHAMEVTPVESVPTHSNSALSEKEQKPNHEEVEPESVPVAFLPLDSICYSQFQLRQIEDSELEELVSSVRERGILQPILVRRAEGREHGAPFELIAGERRFRAARLAGLTTVPALITNVSDRDSLELAIVENAQREDLNPLEEALAYKRLADEFKLNQQEIATAIGKTRSTIANALRLLHLPAEILELLRTGELTAGHARALLGAKDETVQLRLARKVLERGLSVRQLEDLVSTLKDGQVEEEIDDEERERELKALERVRNKLAELLGVERLNVRRDASGRRTLSVTFDTEASWRRFMSRMKD